MSRKAKIHLAFSIAVMAFIFIHSAMPSDLSSAESGLIVDFLMKRFAVLFGNNPQAASFIVRKCAHFLEYTLLGFSFSLTASDYRNPCDGDASGKRGTRAAAKHSLRSVETSGSIDAAAKRSLRSAETSGSIDIAAKLISWAFGTLYAVTDEFHQMFVPGRSCEIRDMCIDSCGVATGVLIGSAWMWWKRSRNKNH